MKFQASPSLASSGSRVSRAPARPMIGDAVAAMTPASSIICLMIGISANFMNCWTSVLIAVTTPDTPFSTQTNGPVASSFMELPSNAT